MGYKIVDDSFLVEELGEYIPFVLNNVSPDRYFNIDLYELFGTEDRSRRGDVGRIDSKTRDFKVLEWDWGASGFKETLMLLHSIKTGKPNEFEKFYYDKIQHRENIVDNLKSLGLVNDPFYMLYVLRYNNAQFPALILEIPKIKWKHPGGGKYPIFLCFKPIRYYIVDSERWKWMNSLIRDEKFWMTELKDSIHQRTVAKFCTCMNSLHGFGVIPTWLLVNLETNFGEESILYTNPVRTIHSNFDDALLDDNQVFWNLFHRITGTKQISESVEYKFDSDKYKITNFTINTLSKRNLVYKQEYGVLQVLWKTLWEEAGSKYRDIEFSSERIKNANESLILRRAFKVKDIPGEESNVDYGECDYDYALNVAPLDGNKKLLFPLTVGLWKKGRSTYDECIKKWGELYYRIVKRHKELTILWYVAIDDTEERFYRGNPQHENFEEMMDAITGRGNGLVNMVDNSNPMIDSCRLVIHTLFKETPQSQNVQKELNKLASNNYRGTAFYKLVKELFEREVS